MGEDFHYRSVIGKLNFLEKSSRIDISYSVHQCAHFSENPKKSHASAVQNIGHYLKGTQDKELTLKPDKLDRIPSTTPGTDGKSNPVDIISKHWEFATVWPMLKPILFWRGETATQLKGSDRIPSTTPGAEPPRDARDSGSARSHSTHLETSSSNRP